VTRHVWQGTVTQKRPTHFAVETKNISPSNVTKCKQESRRKFLVFSTTRSYKTTANFHKFTHCEVPSSIALCHTRFAVNEVAMSQVFLKSTSLFLAALLLPVLLTHISFMYRRRYINLSLTASLNKTLTGSHNLMIQYMAYGVTDSCNSKAGNEAFALPNPTCSGRHRRLVCSPIMLMYQLTTLFQNPI
jgi:hypothetical protein